MCESSPVYLTHDFAFSIGLVDIMHTLSAWIRPIMSPACFLCCRPAGDSGLCNACLTSLPIARGARCPVCASITVTASQCGRCIQRRPNYDHAIAALEYVSPVDHLVTGLKYSRDLSAARALAFMLARILEREPYPDIVLPMPIAPARLRERGFNQAEEIARYACAGFGLKVSRGVAQRSSSVLPQASLPWRERARNVRGVFRCDTEVTGKTIAVIDDVLTTGATLDELAAVLKRAGAQSVVGWIVARTPSHR
jgi:ComF family protein